MAAGHLHSRFEGRVEDYKLYRPRYPLQIIDLLREECGLTSRSRIVDIAAGTGLFAELFLENGNSVIAVEPNREMRLACGDLQSRYPALEVKEGSAESTGLSASIADFVTAAQAIHWFDLDKARAEFARIGDRGSWCVIVENELRLDSDSLHRAYAELILEFGIDYEAVRQRHLDDKRLAAFFAPATMVQSSFANAQSLDRQGLAGRVFSSSWMPRAGDPRGAGLEQAIDRLFARYESGGRVHLNYQCSVSYAQLK